MRTKDNGWGAKEEGGTLLGLAEAETGGAGADEDDFMVASRLELSKSGGKEAKGKRAKHPPNNNGPREMYKGKSHAAAEGDSEGTSAMLQATIAPEEAQQTATISTDANASAPTAGIKSKSRAKVIKF